MVRITELAARSDARGVMFPLALPFADVAEAHAGTLKPGHVRGNHFHPSGRELLVVLYTDRWTLRFDSGEGTEVEARVFEGAGAVQIEIDAGCAHAVINDGGAELQIVSLADSPPVTMRRVL